MFKQVVPLSADDHRELKLSPNQPFEYAREQVLIPLTASELFKASRELVIVFPMKGGIPQALVGYEAGRNIHINESGHWVGRYIPAHLRRYPFIFTEVPTTSEERAETGRRFGLQIDLTAPHLSTEQGERLFDDQGAATELLKRIQQILMTMQQDGEHTAALVAQLDTHGLLSEQEIRIRPPNTESRKLAGFRMVEHATFAKLTAAQLAALRESGALAMIYAHLISLTNLEDGWLAKQVAANAGAPVVSAPGGLGNDGISFDNIDWSKFGRQ